MIALAHRPLTEIEKEMGILMGMKYLESVDQGPKNFPAIFDVARKMVEPGEAPPKRRNDTTLSNGQNLYSLLTSIHQLLFRYTYRRENDNLRNDPEKPSKLTEYYKNPYLREIFNRMAEEFFRSEDKPVHTRDFARIFAKYYTEIAQREPFMFGGKEALCLFFTTLTQLSRDSMQMLDFRRLTQEQEDKLSLDVVVNMRGDAQAELEQIFSTALNSGIKRNYPETKDTWPVVKDSTIELGGRRFLTTADKKFLVTINGGLVPLKAPMPEYDGNTLQERIDQLMETGELLDTIRIKPLQISSYIDGFGAEAKSVDGFDLSGGAPLVCMDVNSLTGLTSTNHDALKDFLALYGRDLFDLAKDDFVTELRTKISPDNEILQLIDVAIAHVKAADEIIKKIADDAFTDKESVGTKKNHVVITMGGGGSGKGFLGTAAIMEKAGEEKYYVKASLDDARTKLKRYDLLTKLGHHADDYMAVEDVSLEIRKRIAQKAIEGGYNLLYDGSGLPWKGYGDLAAKWKKSVATIDAEIAECELYIQEDRKGEFHQDAFERVEQRSREEGRDLIARVVKDKHFVAPASYMEAFADPNIDGFRITDKSGRMEDNYVMAQKFKVPKNVLSEMNAARKGNNLKETLEKHNLLPKQPKDIELQENNLDFLVHKGKNGLYSVMVITNASRFIDVLRKGSLNKDALGYDGLPYISDSGRWATGIARQRLEDGVIRDLSRVEIHGRN